MADGDSGKKKQKHPYGAMFWAAVGLGAAFRALYHPWRALVRDGFPSRCSATGGCDPSMTVDSFQGQTEVYAPVRSTIASAGPGFLILVPCDQAVILEYRGDPTAFLVQAGTGNYVHAGQQIGLASRFTFAVWELTRDASGRAQPGQAIEPASYLATHGCRVSTKHHVTQNTWCANGRKLVVPQAVASQCNVKLPAPSGYALLPVSVTME